MMEELAAKDAEHNKLAENLKSLLMKKETELRAALTKEAELRDAKGKVMV